MPVVSQDVPLGSQELTDQDTHLPCWEALGARCTPRLSCPRLSGASSETPVASAATLQCCHMHPGRQQPLPFCPNTGKAVRNPKNTKCAAACATSLPTTMTLPPHPVLPPPFPPAVPGLRQPTQARQRPSSPCPHCHHTAAPEPLLGCDRLSMWEEPPQSTPGFALSREGTAGFVLTLLAGFPASSVQNRGHGAAAVAAAAALKAAEHTAAPGCGELDVPCGSGGLARPGLDWRCSGCCRRQPAIPRRGTGCPPLTQATASSPSSCLAGATRGAFAEQGRALPRLAEQVGRDALPRAELALPCTQMQEL